MKLQKNTEENSLYSTENGCEKRDEHVVQEIHIKKNKNPNCELYALSFRHPQKNRPTFEPGIREEYLSSVHFLIAIDLKNTNNEDFEIKENLSSSTLFMGNDLPSLYQNNIHYFNRSKEGKTQQDFLEHINDRIKILRRQDNLKKDQRVVFNYITDYCEDHDEFFNIANLEYLKQVTIHSNFIFVKDSINKSGGIKIDEDEDEEDEEEEFPRPSPNRNIPEMLKSFIKFRKCFLNKSLNSPSLYVLKNIIELRSFFYEYLLMSDNYYYASFPEIISSNVSGYCLADDGSLTREVKEFNFGDFIFFKQKDLSKLRIDVIGNGKSKISGITNKNFDIIEQFLHPSLKKGKIDYKRLKEFILGVNKQLVGELYLIHKECDNDVINKSIDQIFDIYSNMYKNLEKKSFIEGVEKEQRSINDSSSVSGNEEEKKNWENPTFRKEKAKKLLLNTSIKKSYSTDLNLICKLTNLKGSFSRYG